MMQLTNQSPSAPAVKFKLEEVELTKRRAYASRPAQRGGVERKITALKLIEWHKVTPQIIRPALREKMDDFVSSIPIGRELKTAEIAAFAGMPPKTAAKAIWRAREAGYQIERLNPNSKPARYVRVK